MRHWLRIHSLLIPLLVFSMTVDWSSGRAEAGQPSCKYKWKVALMRTPQPHLNARRAFAAAYYRVQQEDRNARLKLAISGNSLLMGSSNGEVRSIKTTEWIFYFTKSDGATMEARVNLDGIVRTTASKRDFAKEPDIPTTWISDVDAESCLSLFSQSLGEQRLVVGDSSLPVPVLQWQKLGGNQTLYWLLPYMVKRKSYGVDAMMGDVLELGSGQVVWASPRPHYQPQLRAWQEPSRLITDYAGIERDLTTLARDSSIKAKAIRGLISCILGRLLEGEEILEDVAVDRPTNADVRSILAEISFYRMAYDQAIRQYNGVVAIDPSPKYFETRGNVLAMSGVIDEAVCSFERTRAVNLDVDDDIAFARGDGSFMSFRDITLSYNGVTYVWHHEY